MGQDEEAVAPDEAPQNEGDFFIFESDLPHQPVLYQETLSSLKPLPSGRYVDCTLGAGGHAWGILNAANPDGVLLGLDVDPVALRLASERLAEFGDRVILRRASYRLLTEQLPLLGWSAVDGVLLDLGISSMQLDIPEKGFSFQDDAPLDMRFDPQGEFSAQDLVNQLDVNDLADLLKKYGEERYSQKVARSIVLSRPIRSTRQLAEIVKKSLARVTGKQRKGRQIHPATRTFQALRIAVNDELGALEAVLPQALAVLKPGGRLVVISYHSLEDRLVKQFMRKESKGCLCPPEIPQCICGHAAQLIELNRKPLRPKDNEVQANSRSRSAKLRSAQKI